MSSENYNSLIRQALADEVINFNHFISNENMLKITAAATFLIFDENRNGIRSPEAHAKNLQNLRSLISSGKEPIFDLGPIWSKAMVSIMIAVAKETATLWSEFSEAEISKFDLVMKMFLYLSNLGTNKDNSYKTGLRLVGNYHKNWNTNIRLANVTPVVFVAKYFDNKNTNAVDSLLTNYNHDATVAALSAAGFYKTVSLMNGRAYGDPDGSTVKTIKSWMEDGGEIYYKTNKYGFTNFIYGGDGVGVKTPYKWVLNENGIRNDIRARNAVITINDPIEFINWLLFISYRDQINSRPIEFANGTTENYGLPNGVQSQYDTMYREFYAGDAFGGRCSLWHSMVDFILLQFTVEASELLNFNADRPQNSIE